MLTMAGLLVLALFGFAIHGFADSLNAFSILGFPLGFYMAAQGSLIIFAGLIFRLAYLQDRIDRRHGVSEND